METNNRKKILFLDIDGVLNSERYHDYCYENGMASDEKFGYPFDPEAVANLARIIDETGADIVISSSWKFWGLSTMIDLWKERALPGKIVSVTPNTMSDEMLLNVDLTDWASMAGKGHEIKEWLSKKGKNVEQYAILDDADDMLPEQQSHFVQTNPKVGITEEDAKKTIAILNE